MTGKFYFLGGALAGGALAAYAYLLRHAARREARREHQEDVRTWEGEGGKAAPMTARAVQAGGRA